MYEQEFITFPSENQRLSGKLNLPMVKGIVPVVIFLQGSEITDPLCSSFFERISIPLLESGIACLIYAKRGVGESTGSWWRSTFHERAIDTLAAVEYLKSRSEIDPTRIGLFGHSQGGWICQLTASMSEEIAFIITSAGSAETVLEQILTDRRNHLVLDGINPTIVAKKVNRLRNFLKVLLVLKPMIRLHPLSFIIDYDPIPALETMNCPVLALFGELDPLVPPKKNVHLLEASLQNAKNTQYQIHIFKQANHTFYIAKTGSQKEHPTLSAEFVPGYLETIRDWVIVITTK